MKEKFVGWLDEEWNVVLDHDQPIVRCRDCECFDAETEKWCRFEHPRLGVQWRTAEPDGFCAWGERRD